MIKLNGHNEKKLPVSVRDMSEEHWKALRKLAVIAEMSLPEYIAHLVEEELERFNHG